MRLIDADGIEEFAAHFTEFDGKPLTEREKDLVKNVCGKISTQMPTAYDLAGVILQLRERFCCSECIPEIKENGVKETCGNCYAYDAKKIVRAGGIDEQGITDSV